MPQGSRPSREDAAKTPKPAADAGGSAGTDGSTPPSWQPFADALTRYYEEIQQIWARKDVEQQLTDSYTRLLELLQEVPNGAQLARLGIDLQRDLAEGVREMSAAPDASQRLAQLYSDNVKKVQERVWPADLRTRMDDAYREYVQVFADASKVEDVATRVANAYDRYLDDVQTAWAGVPRQDLGVETLAMIGQTLVAAASAHASVTTTIAQQKLASTAAGLTGN